MRNILLVIITLISSITYSQEYLEYHNSTVIFETDTITNCTIKINKKEQVYNINGSGFTISFYYDDFQSGKDSSLFLFKTNGEYLYISNSKLKFKSNNIEIYN